MLNHSRFPDAMLLPFCPLNRRGPLAGRFGPSAQQPTGQALPSAPAGVGAASQSLMLWHFLLILRVPAGRKKRGFLPKRGFFNGLASLLQETVQALVRCGKAASISCFFLFL